MTAPDHSPHRLATRRTLSRAVIFFERLWLTIWPVFGVAALFSVVALLHGFETLPAWLHAMVLAIWLGVFGFTLWRGVRTLAWPDRRLADRRLEQVNGLVHRPLTTLADRPATTDAVGLALWHRHVAQAAARVGRLRIGVPRPGLAARDRHALRAGLAVALAAAVVVAGPDAPGRLMAAFQPHFSVPGAGPAIQIQGWVTPPGYTRLAPIFLKADGAPVAVPIGSRLTVSVTGAVTGSTMEFAGTNEAMRALDATSFQAEQDMTTAGRLVLRVPGRELAAWDIHVIPDRAPTAAWPDPAGAPPGAPPGRASGDPNARSGQQPRLNTMLPWQIADDYGVTGLQAELRLRDRPSAPPLIVPIPLSGGTPTTARGTAQPNLVAHPWAGLDVTARLIARDALEQTGTSSIASFPLPERVFEHKVAKILIAVRKQLNLTPNDRAGAISALRAVLGVPEALTGDYGAWLNLSAIASLLARDKKPDAVEAAQTRLWELALHLEDGGTDRTARALEAARQAARDALEQAKRSPEEQAKRAELERKLAELQEAIRQHLEALRDEALREMSEIPPDIERLDQREMDRLAEDAQRAAREGKPEEAQERLAELERMLDEMRNAQTGQQANEQRNAERRQRGRQQMSVVQDLIAREGQVLDHTQSRLPPQTDARPRRPFQQTEPPREAQPGEPQAADPQRDQAVQQALRRALGEMMQQFGDLAGKIPPGLNEADLAMRDAVEALARRQDEQAARFVQRAIDALQRGGREMGQQMARQFGRSRPGEGGEGEDGDPGGMGFSLQDGQGDQQGGGRNGQQGRRRLGEGRDPLGRQMGQGTSGADDGTDVQVPEEMERQRTQNLQQELRRRGGERFRPQQELDYIERLLRQF